MAKLEVLVQRLMSPFSEGAWVLVATPTIPCRRTSLRLLTVRYPSPPPLFALYL